MATREKNSKISPKTKKPGAKIKIDDRTPVAPAKDQRFKERWSQLNNDVHSALCYWNDLTEKYNGKVSRDEEHLHEIKVLLKELQSKLKVFND